MLSLLFGAIFFFFFTTCSTKENDQIGDSREGKGEREEMDIYFSEYGMLKDCNGTLESTITVISNWRKQSCVLHAYITQCQFALFSFNRPRCSTS